LKILCAFFILWAAGLAGIGLAESDVHRVQSGMAQTKKELGGIKKKIQEEKERIRDINRKESSVISQLNRLDRSLSRKERELKILKRKLKNVERKVEKVNEDLGSLGQVIDAHEVLLNERLEALYKFGDRGIPQVVFSTSSYHDLLTVKHYLAAILDQDQTLIENYRNRHAHIGNYRKQLEEDERDLHRLQKRAEAKRGEIRRDLDEKNRLLGAARDEKRIHLAAIQELENASAQLQGLINRLEREIRVRAKEEVFHPAGKGFGALRGKLAFPVEGRVLSTFGKNENPKFNTFTVQKGIEIETPLGTEIRAIYGGRVLYSDWFKGYGKILIIDHGEGYYSLSGHLSALLKNVGDEVRRGEVVALAGDTGSLKGPCLYFEIRQRGKPLDPLAWLASSRVR
jgi:septal ring factor EnvC (AmiA/AmiB activator)